MDIRKQLEQLGFEDSYVLEPEYFDDAIIGISTEGNVIYSYDRLCDCLVNNDGMDVVEATEWIEFNTIRSLPYLNSDRRPVVVHMKEELCLWE